MEPGLGEFGDPCDSGDACASRACVTVEGGGYCTVPCTDECPYAYACTSTPSGGYCVFVGRGGGGEGDEPSGSVSGSGEFQGSVDCSAVPGRKGAIPMLGLLILALALRRRSPPAS